MRAAIAEPPSPEKPGSPFPATVVMIPPGLTRRTRSLAISAKNCSPAAPAARPMGRCRHAWVAGPPSPEKPAWPVPARVTIVPGGPGLCRSAGIISLLPRVETIPKVRAHGTISPKEGFRVTVELHVAIAVGHVHPVEMGVGARRRIHDAAGDFEPV